MLDCGLGFKATAACAAVPRKYSSRWRTEQPSESQDEQEQRPQDLWSCMHQLQFEIECLQGLRVCAKARKPQIEMLVYPIHFLIVSCKSLELDAKTKIAADGHAPLACHGDDCGAIVLEYLQLNSLSQK